MLLYSGLNILQITLGLLFQVLLAKHFGASAGTDVYFVSITIISTLSAISGFFTEMFMQCYHDLKARDQRRAMEFYQAVFNVCLGVGVVLFIIAYSVENLLVPMFASGFTKELQSMVKDFISIASLTLICSSVIRLNTLLLNGEMSFALPYLISALGHLSNIIALIFFVPVYGLTAIAFAMLASTILGLVAQQAYIRRLLNLGPGLRFWHDSVRSLIAASFTLQLGQQIYLLKDLAITNILSFFETGAISLFNYAFRISNVIFAVANSPALQVFSASTAKRVAECNYFPISESIASVLRKNVSLYLLASLPFIVFLPGILSAVLGEKLSRPDLWALYFLFLLIIPYHVLLAIELPFVQATIAFKGGAKILRVAIIFLILYLLFVSILQKVLGIYAVPVALSLSQLFNTAAYMSFVKTKLREVTQWSALPAAVTQARS